MQKDSRISVSKLVAELSIRRDAFKHVVGGDLVLEARIAEIDYTLELIERIKR